MADLSTNKQGKVRNSLFSIGIGANRFSNQKNKEEEEKPLDWYILKEEDKNSKKSDNLNKSVLTQETENEDKKTDRFSNSDQSKTNEKTLTPNSQKITNRNRLSKFSQFKKPKDQYWKKRSSSLKDLRILSERLNMDSGFSGPKVGSPSSASSIVRSKQSQDSVERLAIFNLEDFKMKQKKERRQTVHVPNLQYKNSINNLKSKFEKKEKKSKKKKRKRKKKGKEKKRISQFENGKDENSNDENKSAKKSDYHNKDRKRKKRDDDLTDRRKSGRSRRKSKRKSEKRKSKRKSRKTEKSELKQKLNQQSDFESNQLNLSGPKGILNSDREEVSQRNESKSERKKKSVSFHPLIEKSNGKGKTERHSIFKKS